MFRNLNTRQQVAYLAAYNLSSLCVAYLLGITHRSVRSHFAAIGLRATATEGGECEAIGRDVQASRRLARYLLSKGLPAPVVVELANTRPGYTALMASQAAAQ